MKYLVMLIPEKSGVPFTKEQVLEMQTASRQYILDLVENGTVEGAWATPTGVGCCIVNCNSNEEMFDLIAKYPSSAFFNFELTPLCDMEHAFNTILSGLS